MKAFLKYTSKSVTNQLLVMKFAGEFILIYPLYVIMFGDRGGLTAGQVGFIIATGWVLSVVLEIPTGVIADKWPRKYVLITALFAKIAALFSWLVLPNFTGFLLGAGLFALCAAFESGALQAYLYGTLGKQHQENFGKFWARVSAMVVFSYTLAYVCAAIIGVDYSLLLILSILACVVALGVCFALPLDSLTRSDDSHIRIMGNAFSHIVHTRALSRLILGVLVVVAAAEVAIEYLPLYLRQSGVEIRHVPLVLAAGNIVGAMLFWSLHAWEDFLNAHKKAILFLVMCIFVISWFGGVMSVVIGIVLFSRFLRVLQVQSESQIQHLSNNEARATISSLASFGFKLGAAAIVAIVSANANGSLITLPYRVALLGGAGAYLLFQLLSKQNRLKRS